MGRTLDRNPTRVGPDLESFAANEEYDLGYSSVEEARRVVLKLRGTVTKSVNGFLIVEDARLKITWSFPEKGQVGFPAVVRRRVVDNDGPNHDRNQGDL